MKSIRKNRWKDRRGFTLAELLLTVGILAVTASIGILAIGNTKKDKTAMANDDIARQIYMVAQNRMLQMKEYGEWSVIRADHLTQGEGVTEDEIKAYYGESICDIPSDYAYWQEVSGAGAPAFNQGEMRVLSSKEYGNGSLLDRMIPKGALESSAQKHFIIEYNVETATVYGVFYSADGFLYEEIVGDGSYYGTVELTKNGRFVGTNEAAAREVRKKFKGTSVLGYFGGGMIRDLTYADVPMPEVIVHNGEDLILQIENKCVAGESFSFGDSYVTVSIKGAVSGKSREYLITNENPLLRCPYSLNPSDNINDLSANYLRIIKEYEEGGSSFSIVLDSFGTELENGMGPSNYHFNHNFNKGIPSYYPGEDLEITVTVSPRSTIGLPGVRTVKTNSLFAGVTKEIKADEGGIEINALRHLMNLNASVSGVAFKNAGLTADVGSPGSPLLIARAYLSENITFDQKGDDCLQFMPVAARNYAGSVGYTPVDLQLNGDLNRFYLSGKENDSAEDTVSPPHRIYDLSISGSAGSYGLFGSVTKDGSGTRELVIKNLGIVQASGSGATETKIDITGAGDSVNAGAFVGSAACDVTMENCYSTVLLRLEAGMLRMAMNIGGLVGSTAGNLTVKNSYVSGRSKNGRYTLQGRPGAQENADSCYNISFDAKNNSTSVGGLVGYAGENLEIADSYCTASIGNAQADGMTVGNYNIGGLVGKTVYTKILTISGSYFYAYADIPDYKDLGEDVYQRIRLGGLVGFRSGKTNHATAGACSVTDSSYIEEYLCLSDILKTENGEALTAAASFTADGEMTAVVDIKRFNASRSAVTYPYDFDFADSVPGTLPQMKDRYTGMKSMSEAELATDDERLSADDTKAYDKVYIDNRTAYPYRDVTGLGHHYGDWSTELPLATITVEAGIGITSLGDVPGADWTAVQTDGNTVCWTREGVPAGTEIDLGAFSSVQYKNGYQGIALSHSNSQIGLEGSSSSNPWKYKTRAIDTTIRVNADSLVPLSLYCPDETQANTKDGHSEIDYDDYEPEATGNGNYRAVFGYQDVPVRVRLVKQDTTEAQEYDPGITLCFLWSEKDKADSGYTPAGEIPSVASAYGNMCIVDNITAPKCTYYANMLSTNGESRTNGCRADMQLDQFSAIGGTEQATHFTDWQLDGTEWKESMASAGTPVAGQTVYLKKQAYYGYRLYTVRAYAYVTEKKGTGAAAVTWLRTELSDPLSLTAGLSRVPVSFIYDGDFTGSEIGGGKTAARNMYGRYRISITDSANTVKTFPLKDYFLNPAKDHTEKETVYIEYESGTNGNALKLYEKKGVLDSDRSSQAYNSEDTQQQSALTSFPTAAFFDPADPDRTGIIFRGWQDASRKEGDGGEPMDCTDWNWEDFCYEATSTNHCYGPDIFIDDYYPKPLQNQGNGKEDGSEMLLFEKREGQETLVPHPGVKSWLGTSDTTEKTPCFRPTELKPIELKARWWRDPTPTDMDPNGGYY